MPIGGRQAGEAQAEGRVRILPILDISRPHLAPYHHGGQDSTSTLGERSSGPPEPRSGMRPHRVEGSGHQHVGGEAAGGGGGGAPRGDHEAAPRRLGRALPTRVAQVEAPARSCEEVPTPGITGVAPRRKAVAHRPDGGGEAGEQAREPASRTVEVAARADGGAAAPALLRRPLPVARHDGKVTNFAASTAAQGGQRRPSDAAARRPLLRRVLDPERRSAGPAEGARAIESPRGGVVARGGRVDELLQRLERADAQTELPDTPEGLVRLLKVKQGGEVGRSRRSRPKRPGIRAAVSFAPAPPEAS
jgi:hypothetical protein